MIGVREGITNINLSGVKISDRGGQAVAYSVSNGSVNIQRAVKVSGGSGGGGGGGGSSGENYSNILLIEKYDLQISKDAFTSYRFTDQRNPIMFVNITGNTSLGIITASIEVLNNPSTLVNVSPVGLVYKNTNIWVGTAGFATPKNIREGLIKFRIDNSWLSANSVLSSDIVLVKWDGKSWRKLETKLLSKDGTNTYFEAKTNSFSPFAIIGIEKNISLATVTSMSTETPKPVKEAQQPQEKKPEMIIQVYIIFGIMLVLGIIVGMYLLK